MDSQTKPTGSDLTVQSSLPSLTNILDQISNLNDGEPIGLLRLLELNEGIIPENWSELYEVLSRKVDNIGLSIAIQEGEIDSIKQFKEAIQSRITARENDIKNFKTFLSKIVKVFGDFEGKEGNKSQWLRGKIVGIKRIEKIEAKVVDEKAIPEKYTSIQIELTPAQYRKVVAKFSKDAEMNSVLGFSKSIIDPTRIKEDLSADPKLEIPGVNKNDVQTVTLYNYKKTIKSLITKNQEGSNE